MNPALSKSWIHRAKYRSSLACYRVSSVIPWLDQGIQENKEIQKTGFRIRCGMTTYIEQYLIKLFNGLLSKKMGRYEIGN